MSLSIVNECVLSWWKQLSWLRNCANWLTDQSAVHSPVPLFIRTCVMELFSSVNISNRSTDGALTFLTFYSHEAFLSTLSLWELPCETRRSWSKVLMTPQIFSVVLVFAFHPHTTIPVSLAIRLKVTPKINRCMVLHAPTAVWHNSTDSSS